MLFHVYGGNALYQWIAMLGVLLGLILLNEVARRTKQGGIVMFFCDSDYFDHLFYCNCSIRRSGKRMGAEQSDV